MKLSGKHHLTRAYREKKQKGVDKGEKMCGKALKSKLAFRGGAAHEIYTKIFAGNAAFYDPGNGGAPRTIRQAAGAGFYPFPDADL